MAETMETGLPDDLGVVCVEGKMLVYEIGDNAAITLTRCGEGTPLPADALTQAMRDAVDADLAKRGLSRA